MDNRPIGFFDSGLGGLTCIAPLIRTLPDERIIYFGDTARTPYGSKSPETIRGFARQITDFLIMQDVKMIVIACNTVSATCLPDLRARFPSVPIVGIINPAAAAVAEVCGAEERVGVIGTKVTIRSGAYSQSIRSLAPSLPLYQTACPALVPLIEEGIIENEIMDLTIRYYMDSFVSYHRISSLILGCTHYPLILANLRRIYPQLQIINPSEEIVKRIKTKLAEHNLFAEKRTERADVFYASDLSDGFINMINRIFKNTGYTVAFKNFDMEKNT